MAMVAAAPVAEAIGTRAAAGTASKAAAKKAAGAKKAAPGRKSSGLGAAGQGGKQENFLPASPEPVQYDPLAEVGKQTKSLGSDIADKTTLTPPKRLTAGDASGFAFGLVLYCLFINYMRYGPRGVRGWIAAKFINQPLTGAQGSDLPRSASPLPDVMPK